MGTIDVYNYLAIVWFFFCWIAYARFAKHMAKRSDSLSSVLHRYRFYWMQQLLKRDQRVSDAALISNIERNVTFLASSSLLVLAGLLTAFTATDSIFKVLQRLPFTVNTSTELIQLKLIVLMFIYVYAFFTFTWSMRQFGFASVMIGASPSQKDIEQVPAMAQEFVLASGKVIDLASHAYNYGLRAYYFSLPILAWFINTWLFMVLTTLVVFVLFRREFHSKALSVLRDIRFINDIKD